MAITLLEASKINSGDVHRSGIIEMFSRASDLLRVMPFIDVPGGSYSYNQEGNLPGVAFRGFNEAYVESAGVINPEVEVLRIAGGDLDVDKQIVRTSGEDVRSTHEAMKVKALALHFAGKIINGDSVTNPREFDGLRVRTIGNQLIDPTAAGGADGPLSLAQLDAAIDEVDNPTHLIMSKAMRRKLSAAARSAVGGDVTYDLDEFGRRVAFYDDLPILIADHDDLGARIIDFNEVGPSAGAATNTSIYVVSWGEGMLTGLQNGTMDVGDLGEVDDKPVLRTRVEWLVGLAALHGRSVARVFGITDVAITV